MLPEYYVIQTNRVAGSIFRTTVGSPAALKEKLPAPREILIKAGWCNIPLCPMGSGQLPSGCLYKRNSNCVAQMGALNIAGPQSDGYTVPANSVND